MVTSNPSLLQAMKFAARKSFDNIGLFIGILLLRMVNWTWYILALGFAALAHKVVVTKEYVTALAPDLAQKAISLQKCTSFCPQIPYAKTYIQEGYIMFANISGTFLLELIGFTIVFMALQSFITLGFVRTTLNIVDRGTATFKDFTSQASLIGANILLKTIMSVLICLGFACLVIPGCIVLARSYFAPQILVDEHTSAWAAFTKSWELTKGRSFYVLFIALVLGGISSISQNFVLLYLFVYPFVGLSLSSIYRGIRG